VKIGMNTDSVGELSHDAALDLAAELGLECVELATGAWSSAPHLDIDELLASSQARDALRAAMADRGLQISALTCSGNPLDPSRRGRSHDEVTRKTIELAARLDVERVILMSGLPAGRGDTHPNWVIVSWPPEAFELLEWQWNEVVLPYWRDLAAFAKSAGEVRLCTEPHAGQVVYNAPTLLRLREAVGDTVGANLDPSHLMWMGADPLQSIRELGDAIYHVHAKDTRIEASVSSRTLLETIPLLDGDREARAWNYVTLGDGHPEEFWVQFCRELRLVGYDDCLSIEHEDSAVSPVDGVRRSAELLRSAINRVEGQLASTQR
jgi:sugar phosphate isomerase/epimerase